MRLTDDIEEDSSYRDIIRALEKSLVKGILEDIKRKIIKLMRH